MAPFTDIPKSKEEALQNGSVSYFTGVVCQNGHIDKRYTNTGICYACKRSINKRCAIANPETCRTIRTRTYFKNKPARLAATARWAKYNQEATRIIKRRNKEKYRKRYNKAEADRQRERCTTDPQYKLYKRTSKAIWHFLKANGKSKQLKSWEALVPYSIATLVAHIEEQFDDVMSWNNYGSYWHIDHIVPRDYFVKHPSDDKDYLFNCCWSLINLRPLEGNANMSKGSSLSEDKTQELIKLFKLEIGDHR